MKMPQSYRDLVVWKKAMELVTEVYRVSKSLPKDEVYGLTSQMRRSAISIPSNIAEGKGRQSSAEFQHFLVIARGSLLELETQLEIAENLEYLKATGGKDLREKASTLGKMLNGLIDAVSRRK
jgi:four helix bundle protein